MSLDEAKCDHCGTTKAVGYVKTESPTKTYSRKFHLCMPDIIDLERWIENKPNAKGLKPVLIWFEDPQALLDALPKNPDGSFKKLPWEK